MAQNKINLRNRPDGTRVCFVYVVFQPIQGGTLSCILPTTLTELTDSAPCLVSVYLS